MSNAEALDVEIDGVATRVVVTSVGPTNIHYRTPDGVEHAAELGSALGRQLALAGGRELAQDDIAAREKGS